MATQVGGKLIADKFEACVVSNDDPATPILDSGKKQASIYVEAPNERNIGIIEDDERYPKPSEEDLKCLRKVADRIPWVAFLLYFVELAERASYYGTITVFGNFMQFPLPKGGNGAGGPRRGTQDTAGALGKGLQFANAFGLLFAFLAYTIPIGGAWIADARLGRFSTIIIGVAICTVSHIITICRAIPSMLQAGKGTGPFITSLLLLALGAGIFNPNIAPTGLDQYRHQKPYVKMLKSGERVVVDPEATVHRIMLIFHGFINTGAFFAVATTYIEKYSGY